LKKILLIDDDDCCRLPAAELLRHADAIVLQAVDGESGIAAALEHRPDLILCDLVMPRGNGFHVCATLRQRPETRDAKFVMLSGRDYAPDRRSAEEAGADDYVLKPLGYDLLKQVLLRHVPGLVMNGGLARTLEPEHSPDVSTRVKFWGVRGSIPAPGPDTVHYGGNTSCVEVRADGEIIILDAGSGIRPLGLELGRKAGEQPISATLLITHTHWDHIQGFPFFLPAYNPKNRLRILGVEGARASLAATLAGQMESPYFPIALKQLPGNIEIEELRERRAKIGRVRIEACQSNHPDVAFGYRLFTSAGSLVYLPDNETFNELAAGRPDCAERRERTRQLTDFIAGADLLICDAQYDAEEYKTHMGWGHGCVDDVVRFAMAGNVRALQLFHHDPAHDDRKITEMLDHARKLAAAEGSPLQIDAAREGAEFVIKAPASKRGR
jgi:phosphoribosyl 1,2-cyclic phosphodiesterase/CheY-like chemotaxis protein